MRQAGMEAGSLFCGRGCEACRFTGYRGRMAIGETLPITQELRGVIQRRGSADLIKRVAARRSFSTLRDSALLAAREGKTTLAEVLRVTQEEV